jgi:RNA polymerase sigma-70 factor (ECF subfamily)
LDLRDLFTQHYASIWRLLRRLGVREADLDDAAQEVFWVAARRLADIRIGSEHSFLYGVALRVASGERRKLRNAGTPVFSICPESPVPCGKKNPEQRVEDKQARQLLDHVLDQMSPSLKSIFVLYELENIAVKEIAELHEIPLGTANSRLRRARIEFSIICKRVQTVHKREGSR